MSDRESSVGPFALGIALGAALGFFLAPERGEELRDVLQRRLRALRDLAFEKAEELGDLVADVAAPEPDEPRSAREPLPPARRVAPPVARRAASAARRRRPTSRKPRRERADT